MSTSTIETLLAGPFPTQVAVYVVPSWADGKAHVIPTKVSARFSVVRQLLEAAEEMGEPLPECLSEELSKHPGIYGKLDEAGFFNGISGDEVIGRFMSEGQQDAIRGAWEQKTAMFPGINFGAPRLTEYIATPYDRHPVNPPHAVPRTGSFGFGVSMRQEMHSFPVFKIDFLDTIEEQELQDDMFLPEVPVSSDMSVLTVDTICKEALAIIKDSLHNNRYVDPSYSDMLESFTSTRVHPP